MNKKAIYKTVTWIALLALIALSAIWIIPLIIESIGKILNDTERVKLLTNVKYFLTLIPWDMGRAFATILSGWALTQLIAQIQFLLSRKADQQSIYVCVLRSWRDEQSYVRKKDASSMMTEEVIRAIVFGLTSTGVALAIRSWANPTLSYGVSVACIIVLGFAWFTPLLHRGQTKHLLWQAMVDFLVSLAIGWWFGIPTLVAFQVFCVLLMFVFVRISFEQSKRYHVNEEASFTPPDELWVNCDLDESGSIGRQYKSDVIKAYRAILVRLKSLGIGRVMVQLRTFGNGNVTLRREWCDLVDMLEYVDGRFEDDYRPGGGTPLNRAIIGSQDILKKVFAPGRTVVEIAVTDGCPDRNASEEQCAKEAIDYIEGTLKGPVVYAGVGEVDVDYFSRMVADESRYAVFNDFDSASQAIADGLLNVSKGSKKFFNISR